MGFQKILNLLHGEKGFVFLLIDEIQGISEQGKFNAHRCEVLGIDPPNELVVAGVGVGIFEGESRDADAGHIRSRGSQHTDIPGVQGFLESPERFGLFCEILASIRADVPDGWQLVGIFRRTVHGNLFYS